MSAHANPNIVEDNLVFMYDTINRKSYAGEPTINYIHGQNAVAKDSYTTNFATTDGTYSAKHPNAIRAYNAAGTQLSNYYNSGVTDATNTYHAHWQYDSTLKKPVVVMNDVAGTWQAKWMGTGLGSWNSQGKSHGDTYTISWLQWVDHLSKNARAGLYTKNTSGSNGFHDGQATSASSYNTTLRTWQRVYQTYTTSTARDLSQTMASIYMYGMYNVRATVKVADVQFTWGSHPVQFSAEYERSATQALIDRTGNSTIDISNASFDSNAQMTFDGTDDYINDASFDMGTPTAITLECIIRFNGSLDSADRKVMHYNKGGSNGVFQLRKGSSASRLMYQAHNGSQWYTMTDTDAIESDTWAHFMITHSGTSAIMYKNGVQSATATMGNLHWTNASNLLIGYRANSEYWKGDIPIMKIYNRALTSAEVLQNFNATKSRFGL